MPIRTLPLLALAILIPAATAHADIPPLDTSYTEIAYQGTETLSLTCFPNGNGAPFTEAYLDDGTLVDATITLHLHDFYDNPVPFYPKEDIWLEATDFGLAMCPGGTCPDTDTDINGITVWTNPLHAGGTSQSLLQVFVNGSPLNNSPGLNMRTNSPDINGDLAVNLIDLGYFALDLNGPYNYRSDFHFDGAINLPDLGKLAAAFGSHCP